MTETSSSSSAAAPLLVPETALFLDFDGTLAPLQDDPNTVALPEDGAALLIQLNTILNGGLVLISGRGVADLSARTPQALLRIGAHGLEVCEPGAPAEPMAQTLPAHLTVSIESTIKGLPGVRLEEKGRVAAIHYRQNPAAGPNLVKDLSALVASMTDYRIQHGKMVIEMKPADANKGVALRAICARPSFQDRVPVMVGDDTTDEDAIRVAQALGGYGIKVGDGETSADYRLADPDAVWTWIRETVNEHA